MPHIVTGPGLKLGVPGEVVPGTPGLKLEPVAAGITAWYDASDLTAFDYVPSIRVDYYQCAWTQGCTPSYIATSADYVGSGSVQVANYSGASWDTFRYVISFGLGSIKLRGTDATGAVIESDWGTDVSIEMYRGRTLWLDYVVYPSSGGSVSAWRDISGNDRHLSQTTATYRPYIDRSRQNGLPTLFLDGANDYMKAPNTMLQGTSAYTVMAVWHPENLGSLPHLFYSGALSSNAGLWLQEISGDWKHGWYGNDLNTTGATAGIHLHTIGWDGATRYTRTDGIQTQASATGRNTASGEFWLGRSMASNGWMRGKVCELVIYNRWLTSEEIALNEAYLTMKWGL